MRYTLSEVIMLLNDILREWKALSIIDCYNKKALLNYNLIQVELMKESDRSVMEWVCKYGKRYAELIYVCDSVQELRDRLYK